MPSIHGFGIRRSEPSNDNSEAVQKNALVLGQRKVSFEKSGSSAMQSIFNRIAVTENPEGSSWKHVTIHLEGEGKRKAEGAPVAHKVNIASLSKRLELSMFTIIWKAWFGGLDEYVKQAAISKFAEEIIREVPSLIVQGKTTEAVKILGAIPNLKKEESQKIVDKLLDTLDPTSSVKLAREILRELSKNRQSFMRTQSLLEKIPLTIQARILNPFFKDSLEFKELLKNPNKDAIYAYCFRIVTSNNLARELREIYREMKNIFNKDEADRKNHLGEDFALNFFFLRIVIPEVATSNLSKNSSSLASEMMKELPVVKISGSQQGRSITNTNVERLSRALQTFTFEQAREPFLEYLSNNRTPDAKEINEALGELNPELIEPQKFREFIDYTLPLILDSTTHIHLRELRDQVKPPVRERPIDKPKMQKPLYLQPRLSDPEAIQYFAKYAPALLNSDDPYKFCLLLLDKLSVSRTFDYLAALLKNVKNISNDKERIKEIETAMREIVIGKWEELDAKEQQEEWPSYLPELKKLLMNVYTEE